MRAYMQGHLAALVVQYDNFGNRGNIRRIWRQLPAYFVRALITALVEAPPGRLEILRQEILGWAIGLQYVIRRGWRKRIPTEPDGLRRDDQIRASR
jgi:hypothetical protein